MLILGIETSCDEIGIAVFDTNQQKILSTSLFSQIDIHATYGGVVPEIASRSHLEHIDIMVQEALDAAGLTIKDIDAIAVVNKPGLIGSLLVGLCFAKGLAWLHNKKLIGVDHLEGHVFSAFLGEDNVVRRDISFPHINLSVSGGHTSMYLVHDFGNYVPLGQTIDDAAGEAFDKVAKMMGYSYPGGPVIEKLAESVGFQDFRSYPRTKKVHQDLSFTFSGIKTAVLYDLVQSGVYDLKKGLLVDRITDRIKQEVASSLLVCVGDIFEAKLKRAFKLYPEASGITIFGQEFQNKFHDRSIRRIIS